jgi:hypothetical protein
MKIRYALLLLIVVFPGSLAAQHSVVADWRTNVMFARGQNGREITFVCPPGEPASIYGSDVYTDDSSVCTAAVHAGVIDLRGGAITVTIQPGRRKYEGSTRNDVESSGWDTHEGSFTVSKVTARGQVDWTTTAKGLAGSPIQELTVTCPPGGSPESIWGTDIYSDDSSICAAAVHAGVITLAKGGPVTLRAGRAQRSLAASKRNGVESGEYGAYESTFVFAAATAAPARAAPDSRIAKAPDRETATTTVTRAPRDSALSSADPVAASAPARTRVVRTSAVIVTGNSTTRAFVIRTAPVIVTGSATRTARVIKTAPVIVTGPGQ